MKLRLLALLMVLLFPAEVTLGQTPLAAEAQARTLVTLRLFVDLQCSYSRQAWHIYRQTLARMPDVAFVVQHLPLSVHPLAMPAAIAVMNCAPLTAPRRSAIAKHAGRLPADA